MTDSQSPSEIGCKACVPWTENRVDIEINAMTYGDLAEWLRELQRQHHVMITTARRERDEALLVVAKTFLWERESNGCGAVFGWCADLLRIDTSGPLGKKSLPFYYDGDKEAKKLIVKARQKRSEQ